MKGVDLFCGCGGMSLGFQEAGFDILASLDNWSEALNVYKMNFNHDVHLHDLSDVEKTVEIVSRYSPEIIIGGPPCQDYSSAGKRDITLGRADLTYSFAETVNSIKPKWFVMENVEQIKKYDILDNIVSDFIAAGYGLTSVIMDASYCGVPQARKRFFLIGRLGVGHNKVLPFLKKNLSRNKMTIRDYLGDELGLESNYYYRHPRNYNRRGLFSIDEPSPTVRGVNRPIPETYRINSCDPKDADLSKIRPLTTVERSYIQTFPKSFLLQGSKTNLEQMIGNAVPVKLAKFIAMAINDFEESLESNKMQGEDNESFEICQKPLKL